MSQPSLDELCEQGQNLLMETDYLGAEAVLERAQRVASEQKDWDRLSRLYMPLQEAGRQRRQRCGEGTVVMDLIARGPSDELDPERILAQYPSGQLLIAGWGSIEPAVRVREIAARQKLYVETFLAAAYPADAGVAVVIVPLGGDPLPAPQPVGGLLQQFPAGSIVLNESELPCGPRPGTPETYGQVMQLWERLHRPFLAEADRQPDPIRKIEGYRRTIRVDYACELAHQRLSAVARELARTSRLSC